MLKQKVLICGICQNIEKALPYSIKIIENIGKMFSDYRVLVYENNSKDSTKHILKNWCIENEKVSATIENVPEDILLASYVNKDPLKSNGTSRARNIILDEIFEDSSKYAEFSHIIWIDMDFKKDPEYQEIVKTFESKQEWDAVFANGIDPVRQYWDWLPFRDYEEPFGPELLGHNEWYIPKTRRFEFEEAWHPVYSAFGGCGIYKKEALKNQYYSPIVTATVLEFYKKFVASNQNHPVVQAYQRQNEKLNKFFLSSTDKFRTKIDEGYYLYNDQSLVWRVSSFAWQYPVVCDHINVNLGMQLSGFTKLFINTKFFFYY